MPRVSRLHLPAAAVRAAGIGVEIFPDPKKLGQQLKYADQRGFRIALIAGENEFASGKCQVKNLQTATSEEVEMNAESVLGAIRRALTTTPPT
jgi:histidyl-tRNA synthetase